MSALLAVVLALFALSDLIAVSSAEEMARFYWLNQAPVRLLFFFILTGYTYTFKYTGGRGAYVGEDLKNSFVFTWGFVEMVSWFWVCRVMALLVLGGILTGRLDIFYTERRATGGCGTAAREAEAGAGA